MTRRFAAGAILISLGLFTLLPAHAQSGQDASSGATECFPWQQWQDGRCVPKPPSTQLPLPAQASDPCTGAARNLSGPCTCPDATHWDAVSGTCLADAPVTPKPVAAIRCDGGTVADGRCRCPAGFDVMPAGGNTGGGGICVKAHADNCRGGELTVSGTCLCTAEVVMSGETYELEYANGQCVPKRCPVQTVDKDGKCIAISAINSQPGTEAKAKPAAEETKGKDAKPHRCGHGRVRTHAGCVTARR